MKGIESDVPGTCHGSRGFHCALADFNIKARVHRDGGAKISEPIHHLQGVVASKNGGSLPDISCTPALVFLILMVRSESLHD